MGLRKSSGLSGKLEVGELYIAYIHFLSPCWLLWAPIASEVGPLHVKYKNASCYGYSCKFERNKLKTKEINIV